MLPKSLAELLDKLVIAVLWRVPKRAMRRLLHLLQQNFSLTDKWGFNIRKQHYYEPLPDFPNIRAQDLGRRRESSGIDWRLESQLETFKSLLPFADEVMGVRNSFDFSNQVFDQLDAAVFYSLLRKLKPKRLLEVGGGYSTQIASLALQKDSAGRLWHKCVEPYPAATLRSLPIVIIEQPVESVSIDVFKELRAGDVLFIDSTHTVNFGSDVCTEVLEILPVLADGVWVHFHDIFFPYDYPPEWIVQRRCAWNEQYLIEALLLSSERYRVELGLHWLSEDYREIVKRLWPEVVNWCDPSYKTSSLWIQKEPPSATR